MTDQQEQPGEDLARLKTTALAVPTPLPTQQFLSAVPLLDGQARESFAQRLADRMVEIAVLDTQVVDVAGICERFGLKEGWVRANAARIGGFRSSAGGRAEHWFRPCKVAAALDELAAEEARRSREDVETPRPPRSRRRTVAASHTRTGDPLLEFKKRDG